MRNNRAYDYSGEDIGSALAEVGVSFGDSIFIHSNIGFFGKLKGAKVKEDQYRIFKEAIFRVIGKTGTLTVPAFSYSFCKGEMYDRNSTPSVCGLFSEMVRNDPQALRSEDANFSICSIGAKAGLYTKDSPEHSFGRNSFWERFLENDGKFCNFNFDSGSTFIHFVEKSLNVSYRHDKAFRGVSHISGKMEEKVFYHYVYDMENMEHAPDFPKFDRAAKAIGMTRISELGRGQVVVIRAKDVFDLIRKEYSKDPQFLIKGEKSRSSKSSD